MGHEHGEELGVGTLKGGQSALQGHDLLLYALRASAAWSMVVLQVPWAVQLLGPRLLARLTRPRQSLAAWLSWETIR